MAKKSTQQSKKTESPKGISDSVEQWLPWVLAVIAFTLYSTGFGNELTGIDDHHATVDNPAVKNFTFFSGFNLGMYAPVTWIGYEIAYILGKESPYPFHLLSALVHAFNVVLVFRLFQRLGFKLNTVGLLSLIFAIHPLQVEAVAWVAGFSTPLYALFYLLACGWYLDAAEPGNSKKYYYAIGAFLLACLAKSAAVTLPLTLILMDWWRGKSPTERSRILAYAPFLAGSVLFGILTVYSRQSAVINLSEVTPLTALERVLVIAYTPVFYWAKTLLPLKLNIYYSFDSIKTSFVWAYWASLPVLALVGWLAWKWRNTARFFTFGVLFFFAQISVMLPFQPMGTFELCADHYNYLAAIGVFLILVEGVQQLSKQWPSLGTALKVLSVVWLLALTGLTLKQIGIWKNTVTVVDNAIQNGFHQNGRLYVAKATAIAKDSKTLPEALRLYSQAISINPSLWEAYKFRGNIFGMQRMYQQSVDDLSKYIEHNPDAVPELYNRGLSLANLERNHEAIADFTRALAIDSTFERLYRARGNCYLKIGEKEKGDADLKRYEELKK